MCPQVISPSYFHITLHIVNLTLPIYLQSISERQRLQVVALKSSDSTFGKVDSSDVPTLYPQRLIFP